MKAKLKLRPEEKSIIDVGPGRRPRKDANIFIDINYDLIKHLRNPVVWDLNKTPYPFENESIDKIYMESVLEHLETPMAEIMKELWRILKVNGTVVLIVPNSYFITKRIMFLLGIMHNNFRPQHRKYLNYSFVLHTAREAGFWIERELYRYVPFKNLLLPKIEMVLRKEV
ncbi:MAG: methyltransferase domain-containing protein [archaeon]